VPSIFSSDGAANLQSLGGENYISIECLGIGRRGASVSGFRPQLSSLQHHFCVDRKIVQNGFKTIKSPDTFMELRADQFPADLVISNFRDVDDSPSTKQPFYPTGDLAIGTGMRNLTEGTGVKDNSACHGQSVNLLR